ncbi:PDZ domain-containing protein [Microaerobacter geothermalis]|uniref:SepM family pheromone-processing serine protease n=1 Tax=Microaerobacter geothermalis TaxID=674972 RepID=UPI001F3D83B6|nr:SepM family pheromone-processing serine protease [Microaerobacter geothermalis]MCF6095041.1 PDZ domain-containing protein [Microaerobacter geothermalis]
MRVERKQWVFLIISLLFISLFYIQLPYYITQPGSAIDLKPIINVDNGYVNEKGKFMMTTVSMVKTNIPYFLVANLIPEYDLIPEKYILNPHETPEQYSERQLQVMKFSQDSALIVAFQRAGLPVSIKDNGALVIQIIPEMPAAEKLKIGDVITSVNGSSVKNSDELLSLLKGKKAGDQVNIEFIRGGKKYKETIALAPFPSDVNNERAGIGIGPATSREVILPRKVTIDTEQIGGPSAGLMFALEILNQLTPINLTKNYVIAGTGTIDEKGDVGPIGGIKHKVVAADKAGAEIFFAPNDNMGEDSNYSEALEQAKKIGTTMKIVPVKNIDDALSYLYQLEEKK